MTRRRPEVASAEAVAKEARKGYDLLVAGIENTRAKDGRFHQDLARIAAAFEGPLAIAIGNGIHGKQPERGPLRMLVPLNGSGVSRRAAEIAVAIARASDHSVTALYVSTANGGRSRRRRRFRARPEEQAIIKEVVEIADRYDVQARTAIRSEVAPDEAILAEAKAYDLIVMGVDRRPGDKLFFGDTAAAVFEKSPASILFVAS